MDPIKELQAKIKAAREEMKAFNVALSKAADADKKKAREDFNAKREEIKTLTLELDDAIDLVTESKAADAALEKAGALTTVTVPTGTTLAPKQHAEPTDRMKEMVAKEGITLRYLSEGMKNMSGEEMKAVTHSGKGKNAFSESTEGGIILPKSFALNMFGIKWAQQMGWSKDAVMDICKASTMISSVDSLGGYTVPEDFRLPMLDLPVESLHMMQRVTVVPAPTGEITMPRSKQTDEDEYGGMRGAWIEEGGLKNKTDTLFEQVKIATHEYAMYTQISTRLLNRSAIAMENWIQTRGRQVAMDALDQAILTGSGVGQPLGILETDGIRERKRTTAGAVTRTDITKLKFKLKPYHRQAGIYIIDDSVLEELEDLTDNEGRQLFSASMANGPFDRLAGHPYISTTRTPNLGDDGDVIFIDPREYYLPMEQDIMIKRSDDFAITHNLATIVIFLVAGGKLVQPRVAAMLGNEETS